MFNVVDKIDKAFETKAKCTLIDKMGKYRHGMIVDSWIRVSGGKLRGKLRFAPEGSAEVEIDANDILDVVLNEG
jgi:hypothetical protein